jgi:hypothetical protein
VDYLENQCAKSPDASKSCDYLEYEDQDIGFADLQLSTPTKAEVCTKPCGLDFLTLVEIGLGFLTVKLLKT